MGNYIQPHPLEKAGLADAIRRWLDEYHQAGTTHELRDHVTELRRLLTILQLDAPLAPTDQDALLTVMRNRIHVLQNRIRNSSDYFGPPPLVRPTGVFGWFKARRVAKAESDAREGVIRGIRRELGWLELLTAKLSP